MDGVILREVDDQHAYDVHRWVTRSMGHTPWEYITKVVFDPLEPWFDFESVNQAPNGCCKDPLPRFSRGCLA